MREYLDFFARHIYLSATFFITLFLIIVYEITQKKIGPKKLTPQEVVLMMNRENAMVYDLRDASAFKKGHIMGAKNTVEGDIKDPQDKRPIIMVCEGGLHAPASAKALKQRGYQAVFCLQGGMAEWRSAEFPVEEGK